MTSRYKKLKYVYRKIKIISNWKQKGGNFYLTHGSQASQEVAGIFFPFLLLPRSPLSNRLYLSRPATVQRGEFERSALHRRELWSSRLRWPPGCCETRRTKLPPRAEGVGARSLRFRARFSMKSPRQRWRRRQLGIRSSRAFPRIGGALLRCR